MSGGTFDHKQWQITNIADEIEQLIVKNGTKKEEYNKNWEEEFNYKYPDDIIEEFKTGLKYLKLAYIYTQRIDYLIAGDDGEDSFRRRLKNELEKSQIIL